MKLTILTPDQALLDTDVESVTLPAADGEITVLPGHAPVIAALGHGTIVVRAKGKEQLFAVSGGVVEVTGTSVRVLADTADRADELEEREIREAKERAERLVAERRGDAEGFAEATAILNRELARLHTVRRHRSRRSFGMSGNSSDT